MKGVKREYLFCLILYSGLLVYCSLFPFEGWSRPSGSFWEIWLQPLSRWISRTDLATNLLVYIPLGFFLASLLKERFGHMTVIALSTLIGGALSFSLEFIQSWNPYRVASITDFILNTAGCLIGSIVNISLSREYPIGRYLYNAKSRLFFGGLDSHIAILVFFTWVLSNWLPLVPDISVSGLKYGLKPVWITLHDKSSINLALMAQYLCEILTLGIIISLNLRTESKRIKIVFLAVSAVAIGKVFIVKRFLHLEELLSILIGTVLLRGIFYAPRQYLRYMGSLCAIFTLIIYESVTFDKEAPVHPEMNFIPFAKSGLTIFDVTTILDLLWPAIGLSYLIKWPFKKGFLIFSMGSVSIFLLAFLLEWHQRFIPGRYPDLTDVLIIFAGWLIPWYLRLRFRTCEANS